MRAATRSVEAWREGAEISPGPGGTALHGVLAGVGGGLQQDGPSVRALGQDAPPPDLD